MSELQDALNITERSMMERVEIVEFTEALRTVNEAARQVANGEQIYRCSQHGFRGTPRCNDNPACSLQLGVWVTTEDTE